MKLGKYKHILKLDYSAVLQENSTSVKSKCFSYSLAY